MNSPCLVGGDGHVGIWGALREVYPESDEQRCRRSGSSEGSAGSNERGWNHKKRPVGTTLLTGRRGNVLDKLPKKAHSEAKPMLYRIPEAGTAEEAASRRDEFRDWCLRRGYEGAASCIAADWDRMTTFYRYPKEHWRHLKTTNPVEPPFSSVRLRTDAARRYKRVENATAVIWKTLGVAEQKFRRLNAPHLLRAVFDGATFKDGEPVEKSKEEKAA